MFLFLLFCCPWGNGSAVEFHSLEGAPDLGYQGAEHLPSLGVVKFEPPVYDVHLGQET